MLNLTQGHIASNLGVSQERVSKWERGAKAVPPHRMKEWAHTLGCSQKELQELALVPRPVVGVGIQETCFSFLKARGGRNTGYFNRRATQKKGKWGAGFIRQLPDGALGDLISKITPPVRGITIL